VAAINEAVRQWFSVSEQLRVTDRMPAILAPALALARRLIGAHLQADIQAKAIQLAAADDKVAEQLDGRATEGEHLGRRARLGRNRSQAVPPEDLHHLGDSPALMQKETQWVVYVS
jgi:hypothetical protein